MARIRRRKIFPTDFRWNWRVERYADTVEVAGFFRSIDHTVFAESLC